MAPIKFEEQLKDKLEKRSLQPSKDSWAKLSQRLGAETFNERKPWLAWMSIAAGIIIILSVLVQTFNSDTKKTTMPQMVEEPSVELNNKNQSPISNEKQVIEIAVEDNNLDTKIKNNKIEKTPAIIKHKLNINEEAHTKLVENNTIENPELIQTITNTIDSENTAAVNSQINKEALAQALDELSAEKTLVTDREVDSLLKLASKELVKDKLLKGTSKAVDAQALLEEVEDEMGQSFRSKVYEVLKEGYKTVKTAVAQRNN